ncbi:twitching motility protein PilT [Halorubrum sp. DTA98]|uniref:twitching motility protein PilT n=1 Tax=Halorubrum sp. DTA98 TaxID=3402163 RepID=UPI003AADA06D
MPGTDRDDDGDAPADDADLDSRPVVALDASALMAPVEANVRLFEELDRLLGSSEAVVPDAVVAELAELRTGGGEEATAASVGADLAARARTVETDASYADDALLELAVDGRVDYVVTNDRPLTNRVLDADAPVIGLRGRNTLGITEP